MCGAISNQAKQIEKPRFQAAGKPEREQPGNLGKPAMLRAKVHRVKPVCLFHHQWNCRHPKNTSRCGHNKPLTFIPFIHRMRDSFAAPLFHINFGVPLMYAVIKTGGKQYRVVAGEKLKIEQIPADVGAEITLDQILMIGEGEAVKIGTPLVEGATVKATVLSQGRHDKVKIFKMRRRKHYQKHQGHRQNYTEIQIGDITV
jgi:large subunit ribosomal protein L21